MKIVVFDIHTFERPFLEAALQKYNYQAVFIEHHLSHKTVSLAKSFEVVCCFVNDQIDDEVMCELACQGTRLIALRCAGFNNLDLHAAAKHGIRVVRVPNYSPYAVAEHAMALILCLNRKIHRAYQRVRELNFALDGLVGFDLHGKTVGVVGTGRIGTSFINIVRGFGCKVLAFDLVPNTDLQQQEDVTFTTLNELMMHADVISLHLPLTPSTRHIINQQTLSLMKKTAILVNTSRGELIDALSLIDSLKQKKLAGAALDVYEEEADIFFEDFSEKGVQDDVLARLLTFPNVIVTAHQGFLTNEALINIAETTIENIDKYFHGKLLTNEVSAELRVKAGCGRHNPDAK